MKNNKKIRCINMGEVKKSRIAHLNSTACYLKKDNKVLMIKFAKKWGQVYAHLVENLKRGKVH